MDFCEKYFNIFKVLPDIYLKFNKEGILLSGQCKEFEDLFGTSKGIIGKKVEDLFITDIGLKFKSAIIKTLKSKSSIGFEYEVYIENKGNQYFQVTLVPLSKEEVISIVRNITERKQRDEEFLKMEKLNSIGTLAGGIAHDFNNILTIILGNIYVLKNSAFSKDKIIGKLSHMEKIICEAKGLTNQLLTFSKGNSSLKKVVYINNLIKETTSLALSGSNVSCKLHIYDNLWPVEIDNGQISQVISNLIINAYQSMPNGGIVTVRCRNIELRENEIVGLNAGKYINIIIKDQGCGINTKNISKIFDPYFTTKKTGIGLGLSSAYSIIKNHNGNICVKSKEGKGTAFYIYLPGCNIIPLEIEQEEPIKQSLTIERNKILIMDDELEIRDILQVLMENLGYVTEVAKEGKEAIELYKKSILEKDPFDLVIMDLTVPGGMGGEETIKELLKINSNVKSIVSSGYSFGGVISNYKKYGFKGVINKPYTLEELKIEVNRVLKIDEE